MSSKERIELILKRIKKVREETQSSSQEKDVEASYGHPVDYCEEYYKSDELLEELEEELEEMLIDS